MHSNGTKHETLEASEAFPGAKMAHMRGNTLKSMMPHQRNALRFQH